MLRWYYPPASFGGSVQDSGSAALLRRRLLGTALALFMAGMAPAQAVEALVEEAGPGSGLSQFQFLSQGSRVDLGADIRLVLGYTASCVREEITGGVVEVGAADSVVTGGVVQRTQLDCGTRVQLSAAERQESGSSAWRAGTSAEPLLLKDRAPLLLLPSDPPLVVIQRTDLPGKALRLSRPGRQADLAALGIELAPGGIYDIHAGDILRTIEIDFDAEVSGGPVITRFVRF